MALRGTDYYRRVGTSQSIDMHSNPLMYSGESSDESSDESKLSRFICYPVWKRRERSKNYDCSQRELDRRTALNLKMKEILDQLQYRSPTRPYNFDICHYRAGKPIWTRRHYRDTFEFNRFKFMRPSPLERNPVRLSDLLMTLLPFKTRLMAGILVVITSPSGRISPGYVGTHPLDYESNDTETRVYAERPRPSEELGHIGGEKVKVVVNRVTGKVEETKQHTGYVYGDAKALEDWAFFPRADSEDEKGQSTDAAYEIDIALREKVEGELESTRSDVGRCECFQNIGYFHTCF